MEDKTAEMGAYGNLGNVYHILGDFQNAKYYNKRLLRIAEDKEDKALEGRTCGNLGSTYHSLGSFEEAIEFHERHLQIAKEMEDRDGEGRAYHNLGNVHTTLGKFQKAIDYHKRDLQIAFEAENKIGVGGAYAGLGEAYCRSGNFDEATDNYKHCLNIAKEVGHRVLKGVAYHGLGASFESQGRLSEALESYQSSVRTLNDVRHGLQDKDDLKISLRDLYQAVYNGLWRVFLKQGKEVEALLAAEKGRAQALRDLVQQKYGFEEADGDLAVGGLEETTSDIFTHIPSSTVFTAVDKREIFHWVIQNGDIKLRRKDVCDNSQHENVATYL